jgi:hypothetical protein
VFFPLCSFHCILSTVFNLALVTKSVPLHVCRMCILSCGVLVSRPAGMTAVAMVTVDHLMWKLCKLLRLQCGKLRNLLGVRKYSVCKKKTLLFRKLLLSYHDWTREACCLPSDMRLKVLTVRYTRL